MPFNAKFSEDIIGELYKAEDARAKIFAAFALLAVIIGCLGLFGLAAFTAERRTKEIGIRKVLGARTRDIVRLLVWQFSRPVIIANIIAWPVAWWLMRDWLNGFDQRIALDADAVRHRRRAWRWDRDRDGRRPRGPGRARQPDPRAAVRVRRSVREVPSLWRKVVIASAVIALAAAPASGARGQSRGRPRSQLPLAARFMHRVGAGGTGILVRVDRGRNAAPVEGWCPGEDFEPPRPCERQHLKLVRLPIPPPGHGAFSRRAS